MISVDSTRHLSECLSSKDAVVFVHFGWSGQSVASLRVCEALELGIASAIPFYRFEPDEQPDVSRWLSQQKGPLVGGGSGSVVWMSAGRVLGFEPNAARAGLDALIARTRELFG